MSTITLADVPLDAADPAGRLRRAAAAVRVHFTWWGVHRTLTARQKEEVCEASGADARLVSAGKRIVDVRHPALRALAGVRTRAVHYWRGLTLPYVEPGVRLIKQADVPAFAQTMAEFREELADAGRAVDAAYDQLKADARARLGTLFNPADYPPAVHGLFGLDWDFPAVEPPSYLLRLHPEVYAQEQERVARRFEEAVALAEQAFAAEFAKLVSHLAERLTDGPGGERQVFRDSVVGNLAEFFERFRRLNVRSSPDLDALVDRARELVRGVGPRDLRGDAGLRRHLAAELSAVQARLDGLIVAAPRRRLVRAVPAASGDAHAPGD